MKDSLPLHPPRWPLRLLRYFLKKEYLEEIEGDMEEVFRENAQRLSVSAARRRYTVDMLGLLRPSLMRNAEFMRNLGHLPIFRNYVKVSVRGLQRHPLNSSINLFGLAAAIAFCVFAYTYARWTFKRDQFHENKHTVFLTTFYSNREGGHFQYGLAPRPLAEQLKQDFAQVKQTCRVEELPAIVKHHSDVFHERIRFVDPSFLELFTFPLKWGTSSSLYDLNSIVLSEAMSEKYFGTENPVGQTLLIRFSPEYRKEFKVTGVAEKFPSARSFDFRFLINFENIRTAKPEYNLHDWGAFHKAMFVQVTDSAAIHVVQAGMGNYINRQREAAPLEWAIQSVVFEPLATVHLRTDTMRDTIFRGGSTDNISAIYFLVSVCVLMLALACFNYINMAIVSAARRLKELGIRKTIGATRRVIIVQFLSENLLVTSIALFIGLLLGRTLVIPWFERLWSFSMDFRFDDPLLWFFLAIVLFVTGIASGIYPALYVSRFEAVTILKGTVKFGSGNPITRVLLGLQLVLACVFITSAVMFTHNTNYIAQRSWGYDNRDIVYAHAPDAASLEKLESTMLRDPRVKSLAHSVNHIGREHQAVTLKLPDREFGADGLAVDPRYFSTLGISLLYGRTFHEAEKSDRAAVVINETFAKSLGWQQPIGEAFTLDTTRMEVIGVVKDFHSFSFFTPVRPTFFCVGEKSESRYLAIRVKRESRSEMLASLRESWSRLFPETPFEGGYQEDVWGSFYEEMDIHSHVWQVFATVAVILAALGLYGLISLNVSSRKREFSVRKILGARLSQLGNEVFQSYYVLLGAALLLGAPLSYFAIKAVLDVSYTYHVPVSPWSVSLAAGLLIVVFIVTGMSHVIKVIKSNPVEGLKTE